MPEINNIPVEVPADANVDAIAQAEHAVLKAFQIEVPANPMKAMKVKKKKLAQMMPEDLQPEPGFNMEEEFADIAEDAEEPDDHFLKKKKNYCLNFFLEAKKIFSFY